MKGLKGFLATLSEDVTVTRLDGLLLLAVCALSGILLGMLCSPHAYKRVTIGSNNGPRCAEDKSGSPTGESC